jgi:phosphatidylserine decarboxylase
MNKIIDRKTLKETPLNVLKSQKFLYHTFLGRLILKKLIKPSFTIKREKKLSSKKSLKKVPKFIKKNNIDTSIYNLDNINSFNDFFSRKIKDGVRIIDNDNNHLISPCDSKMQAYPISKDKIFEIKNSYYRISDLLKNEELASYFDGGYALIFRLCVDDYHRYCYIDDGHKYDNVHIDGYFHTVNPIALDKYKVYLENTREYTLIDTKNFGKVVQMEVGAMMVGKIVNHDIKEFKRGEEKGYFLFGGSTIVIIVKENVLKIDKDILDNSKNGIETKVYQGEKIASKI